MRPTSRRMTRARTAARVQIGRRFPREMRANAHAIFLAAALILAARGADAQQQLWPASVTDEMFCAAWVKSMYCPARGSDDCPAAHCRLENHENGAERWQICKMQTQDANVWSQYQNEVDQLTQDALAGAPNAVQRWDFAERRAGCSAFNETACLGIRDCHWYENSDSTNSCGNVFGFDVVMAYESCQSYDFSAFEEGLGVFDVIANVVLSVSDGMAALYDSFDCQSKCARFGNDRTTCERTYGCEYDANANACFSPVGSKPCSHTTRPPGAWPTAEDVCPSIRDQYMCKYAYWRSQCAATGDICVYGPPEHLPDIDCDEEDYYASRCHCQLASEISRRTVSELTDAVWIVGDAEDHNCGNHDQDSCVGNCSWRWHSCQISFDATDAALRNEGASDIALAYNRVNRHKQVGECMSITDAMTCHSTEGCTSAWSPDVPTDDGFLQCIPYPENEVADLKEACAGTSADFTAVEVLIGYPGFGDDGFEPQGATPQSSPAPPPSPRKLVLDDESAANDPLVAATPLLIAAAIFARVAYH